MPLVGGGAQDGFRQSTCFQSMLRSNTVQMQIEDYYRSLLEHRRALLEECIGDAEAFATHRTSHNSLKEFDILSSIIIGPERFIHMQACREYQYSLEAILYGNYRHAFSSLRLSFELFCASTYFSAHQMKMNLWLIGGEDLLWGSINNPDKGIYSHNFMMAFNPDFGVYRTQYMNMANKVYRECSEYVHGNPRTHESLSTDVNYDHERFKDFHEKVATVRLCVLFQFFARYLPELDADQKSKVEHLAMDTFGDLPEIQASFGAKAE